jgi:plasmid stability protein
MASLTIRYLDDGLKEQLRIRAANHGHSMEAEARDILSETLAPPATEKNLALAIHHCFGAIGVDSLPIPLRQAVRNPPEFAE